MAPSFDSVASSLLCVEDNSGIFDENDYYGGGGGGGGGVEEEESSEATWRYWVGQTGRRRNRVFVGGGGGDAAAEGMPPMQSEECLVVMVEKECQHMPNADYLKRLRNGDLDFTARKQAIDWIGKVQAHFGFGPLCAYLSINYLDRFLSAYELPKGKAWMMQLLAVACLSIAAKMEETEVPLSVDLQVGEAKYVFEARTIQRMELLVLSTLGWRMQAITPFSFLDHFLNRMTMMMMMNNNNNNNNNGETETPPPTPLITLSIQLILASTKGIDFLEYRPSEIAAAVAIAVVGETSRTVVDSQQSISLLTTHHVQKEKVVRCVELMMQEMSLTGGGGGGGGGEVVGVGGRGMVMPQSPNGVLEVACLSYRSDDTTNPSSYSTITPTLTGDAAAITAAAAAAAAAASSSTTSSSPPPHHQDTKRRKLHHNNSNRPFQV